MADHERDDEIVDEMPESGGAPCGQIFGAEAVYVTDADDMDDMPAPEGRCGDLFGSTQTTHATDGDAD